MVDLKLQVNQVLRQVKDPEKRTVLRMRYLQGKGLTEIAAALHCSYETAKLWGRRGMREITLTEDALELSGPKLTGCWSDKN